MPQGQLDGPTSLGYPASLGHRVCGHGGVLLLCLLQPIACQASKQESGSPHLWAPARTNLQLLESWSSWLIAPE